MRKPSPWAKLTCPKTIGKLSVLRVGSAMDREVHWTRDHLDRIGIQFGFKGTVSIPSKAPKLRGIGIWSQNSPAIIRLTLSDSRDWEIFHSLAEDLVRATASSDIEQESINHLLSRLERWQKLLSRERRGVLTPQEIRGLFGELFFMEQEVIPRLGHQAVATWNGPDGSPQDFAIELTVIEIKTRSTQSPSRITISSPGQLWPALQHMFLVVYPIAQTEDTPRGRSLAHLVSDLRSILKDGSFEERFEEKLDRVGFLDLPEYEEDSYLLGPMESFEVREGFPRIAPGAIPDGVVDVSYSLQLEKCQQFREPIKWGPTGSN